MFYIIYPYPLSLVVRAQRFNGNVTWTKCESHAKFCCCHSATAAVAGKETTKKQKNKINRNHPLPPNHKSTETNFIFFSLFLLLLPNFFYLFISFYLLLYSYYLYIILKKQKKTPLTRSHLLVSSGPGYFQFKSKSKQKNSLKFKKFIKIQKNLHFFNEFHGKFLSVFYFITPDLDRLFIIGHGR